MKRLLIALAIMLVPLAAEAGRPRILLSITPSPSPWLSDWTSRKETVTLTVISDEPQAIEVKLHARIFLESSLQAETNVDKAPVFTVRPGANIFHGEDLLPASAAKFYGDVDRSVIRSGRLPSGSYRFCLQLLDAATRAPLSDDQCRPFTIQSYMGPQPILPANRAKIPPPLIRPSLQWSAVSPTYSTRQLYQVNVMEVLDGQTPTQAFRANRPILDRTISGLRMTWPSEVQIDTPMTYVWGVRALDNSGNPIGDSENGWSTLFTFSLGEKETIATRGPRRLDSLSTPVDRQQKPLDKKDTLFDPQPIVRDLRLDTLARGRRSSAIELISPFGQVDEEVRSIDLEWKYENDAPISYRITLAEAPDGVDESATLAGRGATLIGRDIKGTRFTYGEAGRLKRGVLYAWQVTAHDSTGKLVASSQVGSFVIGPPPPMPLCFAIAGTTPPLSYCISALPSSIPVPITSTPFGCSGSASYTVGYTGPATSTSSPQPGQPSGVVNVPIGALPPGYYTFVVTITKGTCVCVSKRTVIVYPQITVTAASASICNGDGNTLTLAGVPQSHVQKIEWRFKVGGNWTTMTTTGMSINTNTQPNVAAFCTPGTLSVPVMYAAIVWLDPAIYPGPGPSGCAFGTPPFTAAATTVTVNCPPTAGTVSVTPTQLCTPASTTTVTATATGGTGTLWWSVDGGPWTQGPATLTQSVTVPGNHTFQARWTNGTCPDAFSAVATTRLEQPVNCTIVQSATEVCPQGSAQLSLSCAPGPTNHTVQWQYQINCTGPWINATTGPIQNTNEIGPIGTNWTSVCWRATITSNTGICPPVTTQSVTITVIQPPSVPTITASSLLKCPGSPVTITSSVPTPGASAPFTYTLYRNGVAVATQTGNPVFTGIVDDGFYYVWVANRTRCDSTRSNVLQVRDCDLQIAISGPCCEVPPGTPVKYTATAHNNCGASGYEWTWTVTPTTGAPTTSSGTGQNATLQFTPVSGVGYTISIEYTYTLPGTTTQCTGTGETILLSCP